jgi:hypothetical protein
MRTACVVALFICAVLASVGEPARPQAELDQRTLARQLLGTDVRACRAAFEAARTIGARGVGPELRGALIALLARKNRLVADVTRRGEILADYEDPEFIWALACFVAELQDPAAIPVLAEAVDGSFPVIRALARFGERAVPAVVAVATAKHQHYTVVDHALLTLRFMVENATSQPLSEQAREAVRQVARARLTEPGYFTTLWQAIDLAAALDDPELMGIVVALAQDPAAVRAKGVTDQDLVERTRQRARDRLAGFPPLPRP